MPGRPWFVQAWAPLARGRRVRPPVGRGRSPTWRGRRAPRTCYCAPVNVSAGRGVRGAVSRECGARGAGALVFSRLAGATQ